jgi:hypothetical protein
VVAGAGKTILVYAIQPFPMMTRSLTLFSFVRPIAIHYIEELEEASDGKICLAYAYIRDGTPLTVRDILEAFVKQIAERHADMLTLVESFYAKHDREQTRPGQHEFLRLLASFVKQGKACFIVLDGLNESPVAQQHELLECPASLDARLFITSIPMKQLQDDFPQAEFFDIAAHPSDIELHVSKTIRRSAKLNGLLDGSALRNDVVSAVVQKAGPM